MTVTRLCSLTVTTATVRESGSTLYVGLASVVPPTNTKFKPLLLPRHKRVCRVPTLISTKHHISSLPGAYAGGGSGGSGEPPFLFIAWLGMHVEHANS